MTRWSRTTGFGTGAPNAFQAVLQSGTAVMVDATGTPRVKCNCGNPLSPPSSTSLAEARTVGRAWDGYSPSNVTCIRRGTATRTFTLVNTTTGRPFTADAGTAPTDDDDGSTDDGDGADTTYTSRRPTSRHAAAPDRRLLEAVASPCSRAGGRGSIHQGARSGGGAPQEQRGRRLALLERPRSAPSRCGTQTAIERSVGEWFTITSDAGTSARPRLVHRAARRRGRSADRPGRARSGLGSDLRCAVHQARAPGRL